MQEFDQQQARAILKDQGARFLDYLAAVSQTFAARTPQRVEDSPFCILSSQIPVLPNLIAVGPASSGRAWLTVKQPDKPKPVHIPTELETYLNRAAVRKTTQRPKLNAQYDALKKASLIGSEHVTPDALRARAEAKHIEGMFNAWLETTWNVWVSKTRPYEQAFDLYQKLFDLYLRLDKDSDYFELLFGHCILTWSGRRAADYPLILTSAHMIFKEDTGTILIEAFAPSRLSVAPFEGTDLPGYDLLARYQDAFNEDPVNVWNLHDADEMFQHIAKQLGASSRINNTLDLKPGEDPVLQQGWCLLLRKRTDNTSAFYRGLAKKLQEFDYLPEAFDAMFSNVSVVKSATGGPIDDGISDRLLMPLPANEDQKRIIEQLSHNSGVTVQGPPGTGKSHTIVNLISHLLAHGKRVLVTAEKAQALAVLQNKIPEEIRDFAVASIGESVADTETLRLSIQRMQDSLTDVDVSRAKANVTKLCEVIDQADERINSINRELVSRLEHQMDEFETLDGLKSAARTAQWVTDNAAFDIIPDSVPTAAACPLTDEELTEYVSLARELSLKDIAASSLVLPDADALPSSAELSSLYERLDKVHESVSDLERSGLDMHIVDEMSAEQVHSSLNEMRALLDELSSIDGEWERELGRQLHANAQQRKWLYQGIDVLQRRLDQCIGFSGKLLGHVISVPSGNPKEQGELLDRWMQRVQQGKGLPRVFDKGLRSFGESVTVDGYTPQDVEELQLVDAYIEQQRLLSSLPTLIRQTFDSLPIPHIDVEHASLSAVADMIQRVSAVNTWWEERYPVAVRCLRRYFPFMDSAVNVDEFGRAVAVMEGASARYEERKLQKQLDEMRTALERHTGATDSDLWGRLSDSLKSRDYEAWQSAVHESKRLMEVREKAGRMNELHDRLATIVPQWAETVRRSQGDNRFCGDAQTRELAWNIAQARTWLSKIATVSDVTALLEESRVIARQRHDATLQAVGLSARLHLKETQDPDDRTALNIWLDAMKRYGKGTGKNAENYLTTARHELPRAMNAMPVWIMPLHKVMDNFDPSISQLFDVIIVDESSQCDLLSVGVLALARKAVIVGDDKQTSPSNAFKSVDKIIALQNRYIPDIHGKSLFTFDESLYSMSNRVFQSQIMLREHFRCVPEIIDYSNRFYDRQIFPLRERSHPEIGSPLQARYVRNAEVSRTGKDIVNYTEAQAIADQIKSCCNDPRYDGMTFGVVTLMSSEPHQKIVSDKIIEAIGAEEYAKRRLRVGNPPAFQGDERNVIFLSFVAESAGGRAYSATGTRDAQWMNVAASRAQDQLWAFYSMNPADLNSSDLRRGLIEYVRDYSAQEAETDLDHVTRTDFEKDMLRNLTEHGFGSMLHMHYHVGRYVIDCVVTVAKGLSLAIECDGDESRTAEEFAKDISKQRVLERLGWNFIRLSAPAYYLDAEKAMKPVYESLDMLSSLRDKTGLATQSAGTAPHETAQNDILQRPGRHEDHDAGKTVTRQAGSVSIALSNEKSLTGMHGLHSGHEDESTQTDFLRNDTETSMNVGQVMRNGISESDESDASDDGMDYLSIEYGTLLTGEDIIPQGPYENDSKWIQATLLMLVTNEYPLSDELLRKQAVPVIEENGFSSTYASHSISGSLEFLIRRHCIRRSADGFYYPEPVDTVFRIMQGRSVADISTSEVAFVIRRLALLPKGKRRSAIEYQLDRIYGWESSELSKCALVDQAFRLLIQSGFVIAKDERIVPSSHSLDMGAESSTIWQELVEQLDKLLQSDMPLQPPSVVADTAETLSAVQASAASEEIEPNTPDEATSKGDSENDGGETGKRVFAAYGERYHLRYAEPVPERSLPLRVDYADIEEWLMEAIIKLVYSEYPVCYSMLNRQIGPILGDMGVPESSFDDLLHDCLAGCSEQIVKKDDGFYYPVNEKDFPFRIIRHREIGFISVRELAFVMRRIIHAHPEKDKNWLFDETLLVYGFRQFDEKIHRAFEAAYRYLARNHFIVDHDGKLSLRTDAVSLM